MEEGERIESWEDFEKKVKKIYSEVQKLKAKNGNGYVSTPLFRGQSDAKWELKSTLNRCRENFSFPVEKYHWIIQRIKPVIESCVSKCWELPESEAVINEVNKHYALPQSVYEFMAYLRHNGFPSPLLDWTRSPYIAAFFAFNEDEKADPAIFVYIEFMGKGKTSDSNNSRIVSTGPNVTTHKRHHLQQCEYTFCIRENQRNKLYYTSHEDVFSQRETNSIYDLDYLEQDNLKKYILPYSERSNFLSKLNLMNINAYSLFETEEGLMNKLANEEFLYMATGKHSGDVMLR